VLELHPSDAAIIACSAEPSALDRLTAPSGAFRARVAPDELWWIGPLGDRDALLDAAQSALAGTDALVVDQSDGWDGWTVTGDQHLAVLERLMLAPVPAQRPAFLQGAITGVPGKVVAVTGAAHLFVPSPVGHHLRDRILTVMADLQPVESKPTPFTASTSA
jgi:hypothetical protein